MTAPILDLYGNLRVDVLDERGGRLLGHARLRLEAAPPSMRIERGRLRPDPGLDLPEGSYVLMLPSGQPWEVELRRTDTGVLGVFAVATPVLSETGGE